MFKTGLMLFAAVTVLAPAGIASAQGKKPAPAAKAPTSLKCPFCGMMMPSKKSKTTPVAVNVKGHTYYCCTGCKTKKPAHKG